MLKPEKKFDSNMSTITPGDFLKQVVHKDVRVRLNNRTDYQGRLACLDGFMNIAMEDTKEFQDGRLKKSYGDAFIRGNNVLYIAVSEQ